MPRAHASASEPFGWSTGALQILISAFWFSAMALLVKIASRTLPVTEVVLARAVLTLLFSYWAVRWHGLDPWGNRRGTLLLRGSLGSVGLLCFYYAVHHLPLAAATVLHFLSPLCTALLAPLVIGEPTRGKVWRATLLGLVGVWLVVRPPSQLPLGGAAALDPVATLVAVLGAVASAFAYITVRRSSAHDHPLVIVFYFPLVAVPVTLPLALPELVWPSGVEWWLLLGVGITTQLGQVAMTRGLALLPAARATALGYAQIVFAIVWQVACFGEWPSPWALLGAGLIVLAAWWVR